MSNPDPRLEALAKDLAHKSGHENAFAYGNFTRVALELLQQAYEMGKAEKGGTR